MNLKKLLTAVGLLTVSVPTTLSVVACGNNQTDNNVNKIIQSINNIKDLKINITTEQTNETVFNILNNQKIGLAEVISQHKITNFKKELFKLDTANVFQDKTGKEKVTDKDIISTKTYYFKYTYNNKKNNTLVPVIITNKEQNIVNEINKISYEITAEVNSKADELIKEINATFIKEQLPKEIKNDFKDNLLQVQQINKNEKDKLIDADLKVAGKIEGTILYNYNTLKNQKTKLTINVSVSEQQVVDAIKGVKDYKIAVDANSKAADLIKAINAAFIKEQLSEEIKKAFQDKAFSLTSINKNDKKITDNDLTVPGLIDGIIKFKYNKSEAETKIVITINPISLNGTDVSKVNLQGTNPTNINALKEKFTVTEILKDKNFTDAITKKVNNKDISNDLNNYEVKGIFSDIQGKNVAKNENITDKGTTLYIKIAGKNKLTGEVIIKLIIPAIKEDKIEKY